MIFVLQRIIDTRIPDAVRPWLFALALLAVVIVASVVLALIKRSLRHSLVAFARRTSTHLDDLLLAVIEKTSFVFLLFMALWIAPYVVQVPKDAVDPMRIVALLALLVQLAIWTNAIISSLVERVLARAGTHASAATAATALAFVARMVAAAIILLIGLDNFNVDVTAMVAGLGIGGIIVALALQNLLRDLLGALAIVMGRPFLVGDVIESEKLVGTVEYVGMRSTQLRSLDGEEVIIPNNKLLESPLKNLSRRRSFRAVINLRLSYDTPHSALSAISEEIRDIVTAHEQARLDGVFVKNLGQLAIEVEAVYHVTTTDHGAYMRLRHQVNLKVLAMLAREGVEMARYPDILTQQA